METFFPVRYFLRVKDKYCPKFVGLDKEVPAGPSYVYTWIYQQCAEVQRDRCTVSQTMLAADCKCSIRSLQSHLRLLARLGYLAIERDEAGGPNTYTLLLSSRVRFFARRAGMDVAGGTVSLASSLSASPCTPAPQGFASPAQNMREGGAKSASFLKRDQRDKRSPLSPHSSANGQGESTPLIRSSVTRSRVVPQADGWGDFSCGKKSVQAINAAFEQVYTAYPRKEAREAARSAWHQLWRNGSLPAPDRLLAALDAFRASPHWSREHGRFVPYLVNWLRGQRWLDEAPVVPVSDTASVSPGDDQIRIRLDRLHERLKEGRPNPALESVRPAFEAFLSRFSDGEEMRGPAWGLWSLLHRKGNAPTASHAAGRDGMGVLAFLRQWQWGDHVAA